MPPQRWRLTLRRDAAQDVAQRDLQQAWESTIRNAGLLPWPPEWLVPLPHEPRASVAPGPRLTQPKVVLAAPLPLRMSADRELADLYLPQPIPLYEARRRLAPALPPGHALVDLYDVWFGAPALPGMVVAADYRVIIDSPPGEHSPPDGSRLETADSNRIATAIDTILASETVLRGRTSEGRGAVNLRPLVLALCVMDPGDEAAHRTETATATAGATATATAATTALWMRLRLDSSVGSGRPDDVVDAIAARLGQPMTIVRQHRERLWLRDDAGCPVPANPAQPSTAQTPPAGPAGHGRRSNPRGTSGPSRS